MVRNGLIEATQMYSQLSPIHHSIPADCSKSKLTCIRHLSCTAVFPFLCPAATSYRWMHQAHSSTLLFLMLVRVVTPAGRVLELYISCTVAPPPLCVKLLQQPQLGRKHIEMLSLALLTLLVCGACATPCCSSDCVPLQQPELGGRAHRVHAVSQRPRGA